MELHFVKHRNCDFVLKDFLFADEEDEEEEKVSINAPCFSSSQKYHLYTWKIWELVTKGGGHLIEA